MSLLLAKSPNISCRYADRRNVSGGGIARLRVGVENKTFDLNFANPIDEFGYTLQILQGIAKGKISLSE